MRMIFPPKAQSSKALLSVGWTQAEQSEQDHQNPDFFTHLFMCMSNLSTGYWRLLVLPGLSVPPAVNS